MDSKTISNKGDFMQLDKMLIKFSAFSFGILLTAALVIGINSRIELEDIVKANNNEELEFSMEQLESEVKKFRLITFLSIIVSFSLISMAWSFVLKQFKDKEIINQKKITELEEQLRETKEEITVSRERLQKEITETATQQQIFGDFVEGLVISEEYLIVGFYPTSIPIKQRWRNNGLSADFLADYSLTFFPASEEEPNSMDKQAEIKSAVSYIANELLENAMKFNDEKSQQPISISLQLQSDKLLFLTTNGIASQEMVQFQRFIKKLTESDPEEMYISQLEKNAEDTTNEQSRLGYLTMINDYLAKIGWKFETLEEKEEEIITVTTMVQLTI